MTDGLVYVIGGSAGAVSSIIEIVRGLPSNFPAPICVTIHISAMSRSVLPSILQNASPLTASHAQDGDPLRAGRIYVAPPDWHLIVNSEHIELSRGPRENRHRPAIDVLFRSAAAAHGPRVVAILLSGFLDDGTPGLVAVKKMGGTIIIQDPNDTIYPDMPKNALDYVQADYVLPLSKIPATMLQVANSGIKKPAASKSNPDPRSRLNEEIEMINLRSGTDLEKMPGKLAAFACPDCRGALWEIEEGRLLRYRCHEGHAFSQESLLSSKSEELEDALWSALRALDEKAKFATRLLERAQQHGQHLVYEKFKTQSELAKKHADQIRNLLKDGQSGHLPELYRSRESELNLKEEY